MSLSGVRMLADDCRYHQLMSLVWVSELMFSAEHCVLLMNLSGSRSSTDVPDHGQNFIRLKLLSVEPVVRHCFNL